MANAPTRLLLNDGAFLVDLVGGPSGPTTLAPVAATFGRVRNYTLPLGPTAAALAGGLTVFAGTDSTHGTELWVTDGTTGGTHLVTSLAPDLATYRLNNATSALDRTIGSLPADFVALDATHVLFTAMDATGGRRLWITDGTAAGTMKLGTGMATGFTDGAITPLGNGKALFTGSSEVGFEPWITDGTLAGTHLLADVAPGRSSFYLTQFSSDPNSYAALGDGRAIFVNTNGGGELWITDGTTAGTTRIVSFGNEVKSGADSLTRLGNGLVVFSRTSNPVGTGFEPWVTDGTAAGTRLLLDTVPGIASGIQNNPVRGFGVVGDGRAVFFVTSSPAGGGLERQLWITDGTSAGTVEVKDFGTTATSYALTDFLRLADGRIAFTAALGTGAPQLWATDGTATGTTVVSAVQNTAPLIPLSGSALVDAPFYYAHYADVAVVGMAAAAHYDLSGWHEGRDPDAFFSTPGYLDFYKDVQTAGIDPLTHYDTNGWKEGRDPSAAFDTNLYLLFNPDVKAAGLDPLQHWLADCQAEGRKMSAAVDSAKITDLFDPTFYGLSNADVTAAGADLATHFNTYGVTEGRNPDAFFDVKYYLAQNPDVAAAGINPVAHYLTIGWTEGRDPSTHFSTAKYLAAYADVRAAGINPLAHFLTHGITEGRSGFGDRI